MITMYYSTELKKWVVRDSENDQIFGLRNTELEAELFAKEIKKLGL